MARTVSVSARLIKWPERCACCMRPADTVVEVQASREKGPRVEFRTWEVPYCEECVQHAEMHAEMKRREDEVWAIAMAPVAGGLAFAVGYLAEIGLMMIAGFAVALFTLLGLLLKGQSASAAKRKHNRLYTDRCACPAVAVVYEGWSGSVHTFIFHSGKYADAFEDANAKKLVT